MNCSSLWAGQCPGMPPWPNRTTNLYLWRILVLWQHLPFYNDPKVTLLCYSQAKPNILFNIKQNQIFYDPDIFEKRTHTPTCSHCIEPACCLIGVCQNQFKPMFHLRRNCVFCSLVYIRLFKCWLNDRMITMTK